MRIPPAGAGELRPLRRKILKRTIGEARLIRTVFISLRLVCDKGFCEVAEESPEVGNICKSR